MASPHVLFLADFNRSHPWGWPSGVSWEGSSQAQCSLSNYSSTVTLRRLKLVKIPFAGVRWEYSTLCRNLCTPYLLAPQQPWPHGYAKAQRCERDNALWIFLHWANKWWYILYSGRSLYSWFVGMKQSGNHACSSRETFTTYSNPFLPFKPVAWRRCLNCKFQQKLGPPIGINSLIHTSIAIGITLEQISGVQDHFSVVNPAQFRHLADNFCSNRFGHSCGLISAASTKPATELLDNMSI